ncbi:hypothetical protein SEVIR_2G285750v4 [Setaria viridis]|uniref:DUF834 domain-containing protein n=1 Tax=Setaria viridis TaxID=4556 RepID=A0A4U6VY81_SETVI|nr:hypothetical protein SEVIR_2G285750v2 [Setaria viridis]
MLPLPPFSSQIPTGVQQGLHAGEGGRGAQADSSSGAGERTEEAAKRGGRAGDAQRALARVAVLLRGAAEQLGDGRAAQQLGGDDKALCLLPPRADIHQHVPHRLLPPARPMPRRRPARSGVGRAPIGVEDGRRGADLAAAAVAGRTAPANLDLKLAEGGAGGKILGSDPAARGRQRLAEGGGRRGAARDPFGLRLYLQLLILPCLRRGQRGRGGGGGAGEMGGGAERRRRARREREREREWRERVRGGERGGQVVEFRTRGPLLAPLVYFSTPWRS